MQFAYKAKNSAGALSEGVVEAPSEDSAVATLHNKGLTVFFLNEAQKNLFLSDLNQIFEKVKQKDIVIFTRQLSTLIEADISLSEGLRTLAKQVEKNALKKVILSISESVENGSSLSNALAIYPKLFSSFYIKLIQSGEISGKLHDSLLYLAQYLERSSSINSKIRSALMYPAFVLSSLIAVGFIMVIYVLPQLLSIFKEVGAQDLPLTTRMLIWTTDFINRYLYFLIIIIAAGAILLRQFIKTPRGKEAFDQLRIGMPSLGVVVRNLYLARTAESLSTLIASGIPILDALRITADLVGNIIYRDILLAAQENVRGGGSISEVLSRYKEFPPLFSSMVAIGEKTGKLDEMLEHVAKFYKSESDNSIDSISQLIEPILVLLLGFGVAMLVSSILLPIYGLVGVG